MTYECWINGANLNRYTIHANSKKEALKKFANMLGIEVSGYLHAAKQK